jgi:hypothetical protein
MPSTYAAVNPLNLLMQWSYPYNLFPELMYSYNHLPLINPSEAAMLNPSMMNETAAKSTSEFDERSAAEDSDTTHTMAATPSDKHDMGNFEISKVIEDEIPSTPEINTEKANVIESKTIHNKPVPEVKENLLRYAIFVNCNSDGVVGRGWNVKRKKC